MSGNAFWKRCWKIQSKEFGILNPRLAWPKVEVWLDGVSYLPARVDPQTLKSKSPKWLKADEIWASGAQLRELFEAGKIDLAEPPFADLGRVTGSGEPAFRPWKFTRNDPQPKAGSFDEVLVRARLMKLIQVYPGVKIELGQVFVAPYEAVRDLTIGLPAPVQILQR